MNKFKKIAIIDNIILFSNHIEELKNISENLVWRIINKDHKIIKITEYLDGPTCNLEVGYERPSEKEVFEIAGDADAVITCWTKIPDKLVIENKSLKYIGFWTNLYSHKINEKLATQKGIHIDYIPDYGTESVAEFVFAGLHMLLRKINEHYKATRTGKWDYENLKVGRKLIFNIEEIEEENLMGKKIGIVGLGRIGTRVAKIAKFGYNMEVGYFSRSRKRNLEKQLGIEYFELVDLFHWSDIITLHLSPDSPKLINKELLNILIPNKIFVNTGSAHSVDEKFLIELIKEQKIRAFLDVYEGLPPRKELKNLPNVVFTYRAAWFTKQALVYKADQLLSKMKKYLANNG